MGDSPFQNPWANGLPTLETGDPTVDLMNSQLSAEIAPQLERRSKLMEQIYEPDHLTVPEIAGQALTAFLPAILGRMLGGAAGGAVGAQAGGQAQKFVQAQHMQEAKDRKARELLQIESIDDTIKDARTQQRQLTSAGLTSQRQEAAADKRFLQQEALQDRRFDQQNALIGQRLSQRGGGGGANEAPEAGISDAQSTKESKALEQSLREPIAQIKLAKDAVKKIRAMVDNPSSINYAALQIQLNRVAEEKGPLAVQERKAVLPPSLMGDLQQLANYATGGVGSPITEQQLSSLKDYLNKREEEIDDSVENFYESVRPSIHLMAPGLARSGAAQLYLDSMFSRVRTGGAGNRPPLRPAPQYGGASGGSQSSAPSAMDPLDEIRQKKAAIEAELAAIKGQGGR